MWPASACPACSGDGLKLLLEPSELEAERRWLHRFGARVSGSERGAEADPVAELETARILSCRRCGTVLRDPMPGEAGQVRVGAGLTRSPELAQALCCVPLQQRHSPAPRLARHLPASPSVLGVGRSPGELLGAARLAGWRVADVERFGAELAVARAAAIPAHAEVSPNRDLPSGVWDAVLAWDGSLLGDLASFLARSAAWLKPGGLLELRIPNGKFELGCLYLRRRWRGSRRVLRVLTAQAYNGFLAFPHPRGYTPTSIRRILAAHGFATEAIAGDTALGPPLADPTALASREGARYRRAIRRYCRTVEAATGCLYHPWLEVVARKSSRAGSCRDAGVERAGRADPLPAAVGGVSGGEEARARRGERAVAR